MLRITLLLVLAALCACGHDLDALYAKSASDAGSPLQTVELPFLPALPDPDARAVCEACAHDKCEQARANCLDDDACTAVLVCQGACDDPACLTECVADHGSSSWFDDYWACTFRESCAAECKSGQNFACRGNYAWPSASQTRFPVRLNFTAPRTNSGMRGDQRTENFLVGAQVRACDGSLYQQVCRSNALLDEGRVDVENAVELELTASVAGTFVGSLEIEDGATGPHGVLYRLWLLPIWRTGEIRVPPMWRANDVPRASNGAIQYDEAPLWVIVTDCLGVQARRIRVELPALPNLRPLYRTELSLSADAPPNGVALVPAVPAPVREGRVAVQALDVDTGEVLGQRADAHVSLGFVTAVWVAPRTR